VNEAGSNPPGLPGYEFVDEQSFLDDQAALGISEDEFDDHLRALEELLLGGPIEWSGYLPTNPAFRVACSDATEHSPNALRVTFRVEGPKIIRMAVELRGFTPDYS
jgi:hypothetical protein